VRDPGLAMSSPVDPPPRGVPLGWRLAVSTGVIIAVVMGTITFVQQVRMIRNQQEARKELLRESITPLVHDLAAATSREAMFARIRRFHQAYTAAGHADHHMVLQDDRGTALFSTLSEPYANARNAIEAAVSFRSPTMHAGYGTVTIREDASDLRASIADQWRAWRRHMLITIVSLVAFLHLAIRRLITRPLEQLLDGIQKMEMGYWGDFNIPRGVVFQIKFPENGSDRSE